MKYFYLLALMISIFMMHACSSKTSTTPIKKTKTIKLSKITYPKQVGDYTLESEKSLKSDDMGIMLRYIDQKKTHAYLDCQIYPQGSATDPKKHYEDLLISLEYMKKQGVLKQFNIISVGQSKLDANHTAKVAVFEMENASTPYYSALYLAPIEDYYYRVRISSPRKASFLQSDYGEKVVQELFKAINFHP